MRRWLNIAGLACGVAVMVAGAPAEALARGGDWTPGATRLAGMPTLAAPKPAFARIARMPVPKPRPPHMLSGTGLICSLIAESADRYGLPPEFFARLIWKESRFDAKALSPAGAQGIAQFMPTTARIRGLEDPWDPRQAIPASAHFLADLKARFGNFGLAAGAYNGGPDRIARWLANGGGWLPTETINYVHSITFRPIEWFREPGREVEPRPLEKGTDFMTACTRLPIIATRSAVTARARRAPWGVQVAAGITRRAALQAFRRARARLGHVIGGRSAIIIRSRKGSVRHYSARVGASSRGGARRLCGRIRAAGGNCVVRRN